MWCRRCKGKCRSELPPGKWCPTCGKLLALGAWCPVHGDPSLLADTFHNEVPRRPRLPRWARTLGFTAAPTDVTTVKSAFRRLALANHPDRGGHAAAFIKVKAAYDAGLAAVGGRS